MSNLRNMACQPLSPGFPSLTDLKTCLDDMSLEELEAMKGNLLNRPFDSATSTLSLYSPLISLAEDKLKYILYYMHTPLQEYLETHLSPNQLIFCYWYTFTITENTIDPYLALFHNLCRLASKVLNNDLTSQPFTPEVPASDWIEALQSKRTQAKNFIETLDVFRESKALVQAEKAQPHLCPLQFWHNVCNLLIKVFPTIKDQQEKAFTALLSMPSTESIVRASLGLKYLFKPPATTPISFDTWANVQGVHACSIEFLSEKTLTTKTASAVFRAIEAMLGESIDSDTFFQKIQGKYLELFIRLAEGPSIPSQLVVPLIERLLEKNHLFFSEVLSTIDEALQHIAVNPCEFHACVRLYPKLLALFKQIHQEGNWESYDEHLTPLFENLGNVKWDTRDLFSAKYPLIKKEVFTSVSFQQVRMLIGVFKEAKTLFPEADWVKKGERKALICYLEMLSQAIKKISQFKRQGLQPERLRRRMAQKNALVIELVNTFFSLRPTLSQAWIQKHILPLNRANITSHFDSELIVYMKGDRILIGRREHIIVFDPLLRIELRERSKYPPQFPSPPNGSFIRSLCVKKLPASPLTKTEKS